MQKAQRITGLRPYYAFLYFYASRSLTDVELDEIQRSDKPKGTAFFMGSAHQRAMLSVVASETVETLFFRYITQEAEMPAFTPAAAEDPHEPDELETLAAAPGPGASEPKQAKKKTQKKSNKH